MIGIDERLDDHAASSAGARHIGLVHLGSEASVAQQERLLAEAGCEAFWRVTDDARGRQQLDQLIGDATTGSRLSVTGLEAFGRSLPEVLRLLRGLIETGVTVSIVDDERTSTLAPSEPVAEALRVLSSFASHHREAEEPNGSRRRPRTATLSEIQIKYARRLFSEGEPLRTIGLILRVAPDDVWKAISKSSRGGVR